MRPNTTGAFGTNAFASARFPSQHRVQAWEQHNATSLVALQAAPVSAAPFAAEGINLNTPDVDIARVRCTPHKVSRTAEEISTHPVQGAVIYLNLDRRGAFWHRDQRFELNPWQALIVDGDQAFEREFQFGTDEYVFRVPRPLLAQATDQRNFAQPRIFNTDLTSSASFAVSALRALAAEALTQQRQDWENLASRTSSLLSLLLGEQPSDLFGPAQALIRQHCTNPDFDASQLARVLSISTRQLTRVFAYHNTSAAKALLQARLNHAHALLRQDHDRRWTIADIATASGFSAQAHFSRTYRKKFGISPLQHRKQLLG